MTEFWRTQALAAWVSVAWGAWQGETGWWLVGRVAFVAGLNALGALAWRWLKLPG